MERGFASYGATRCPARAIRTAASTKRELLAGFHNCTSLVPPSVVPQLGDVSYGNRAAQQFVRGNLLVSVANAGTVEVDVRPFAVALDEKVSDCLH